jgi:ribosome maturation protein Sdo1
VKKVGKPLGEMRSPGLAEVYDCGDLSASSIQATETIETSNRKLTNEIAAAKIHNRCVVTQESPTRIPTVCNELQINCIDLEKFLEQQQLKY